MMSIPEDLAAIFARIASNTHTDADRLKLQQMLGGAVAAGEHSLAISGDANGATIATGDGSTILNIVFQADGLRIGENVYQGNGAEVLRSLLQEILQPEVTIDWQQSSRTLLDHQIQRLTTNPLTHAEGIVYRPEQVYVPLGLVERKRQSRRQDDVPPEQGSLLYEETEITQKFEHEAFLDRVLRQGQSPRSGGRRIAIIGEPGAGKTTLLQQTARWISENIERAIAIWISLADLQGRSLEDYLLEQWLPSVVQQQGQADVAPQVRNALVAQFRAGRVWLLLDGVDEMPVATGNPLGEIERQVRLGGLLAQARVVLTCRLNLWDGNRHALDSFDVYRTLEFAYPGQVEQFVEQWFRALPEAQVRQAERLYVALRQPGKERLRDLTKNPLRLTLLCFNWYLGEGTLPETKAGLYEQFVADFYEWKRERFPTTAAQRRRLNAALGKLAREAIDKEETRFRLRHDFVCEFLGDPDEPDSLFEMALRLGWLNQIGIDAENRRKAVYAFFHPTFQEYFAALAIDDWHFFLNHIPGNPGHLDACYRIFEPSCREVFLLWMGIPEKKCKEILIQMLINFDDGCLSFYSYQAYFLAAIGIGEFKSHLANEILFQVIDWSLCQEPVRGVARTTLKQINSGQAVETLVRLVEEFQDDISYQLMLIRLLTEIGKENTKSTSILIALIYGYRDVYSLQYQDNNKNDIISYEIKMFLRDAIKALEKIGVNNVDTIVCLESIINTCQDERICQLSAEILEKIDPGNVRAKSVPPIVIPPMPPIKDFEWKIPPNIRQNILFLVDFIKKTHDKEARWQAFHELGRVDSDRKNVISLLVELSQTITESDVFSEAIRCLNSLLYDKYEMLKVVLDLKLYLVEHENDYVHYINCYEIIWKCARNLSYPDFYNAWHRKINDF